MKKREKLAQLVIDKFREMGYNAESCILYPTTGAERTNVRLDIRRFWGIVVIDRMEWSVYSWNTMTQLLKTGIDIKSDHPEWEISSHIPSGK